MNNSIVSINNIIKYIIIMGLVYYILKIIPTHPINNKDVILILMISCIGLSLINCALNNTELFTDLNPLDTTIHPPAIPTPAIPTPAIPPPSIPTPSIPPQSIPPQSIPTPAIPTSSIPTSSIPTPALGVNVSNINNSLQTEIDNLKAELQKKNLQQHNNTSLINNYLNNLFIELNKSNILSSSDIQNIQLKLKTNLLSLSEVISSLEILKKEGPSVLINSSNSGNPINSGLSINNSAPVPNKSTDSTNNVAPPLNTPSIVSNVIKNDFIYNELPVEFSTPIGDKIANDWDNEFTLLNTDKWTVPMPKPPVCINSCPCPVFPIESGYFPVNLKNWDQSRYVTKTAINKDWAQAQASSI
jgi:hypothetical protein